MPSNSVCVFSFPHLAILHQPHTLPLARHVILSWVESFLYASGRGYWLRLITTHREAGRREARHHKRCSRSFLSEIFSLSSDKVLTWASAEGFMEYATLKRCMEKRVRETAQVTAVTRDHTVQPCSPCSPNPDRPSGVLCNLENEGTMSQELEELTSSSTGTGLNTPGQQCPPNEGEN